MAIATATKSTRAIGAARAEVNKLVMYD